MPVFRVERNKGYTVMSNHHLRDRSLSLKAKGLLSQMLSLPEEWDYTLSGLAAINREGKDAIRSCVHELEQAGYIRRRQTRSENGSFSANEYVIYEQPVSDVPPSDTAPAPGPSLLPPSSAAPLSGFTTLGGTSSGSPTQLNKDKSITDPTITDSSITDSFPSPAPSQPKREEPKGREAATAEEISACQALIRDNIGYDELTAEAPAETELIDELVQIIAETVCSRRKTIRIGGEPFFLDVVRSRLLKLNGEHIRFVLHCMRENTTQIRNIRQYLLTVLFHAPSTIGNYYSARVSHDLSVTSSIDGSCGRGGGC